jgi:hypothetical protein
LKIDFEINKCTLNEILFADDQVILASTEGSFVDDRMLIK